MGQIAHNAWVAAEAGDIRQLRALAEEHGSAALRGDEDPDRLTTLHFATAAGPLAVVCFLISDEIGADVNAARGNNFTPLHAAAMQGRAEICKVLLHAGARPDVQTSPQGYTPLHSAAWAGHGEVIEALVRAGARTDLLNYRGETPAQTAHRQKHQFIAEGLDPVIR